MTLRLPYIVPNDYDRVATQANFDEIARSFPIQPQNVAQRTPTTTAPVNPVDGQDWFYLASDADGVVWHFKYRAAAATYKWEFVGGGPLYQHYIAETVKVSAANATWFQLGSNDMTLTAPLVGKYLATFSATLVNTSVASVLAGIKIGSTAPTTTSASVKTTVDPAGAYPNVSLTLPVTTTAISTALQIWYYQSSGGTANFGRSAATFSLIPVTVST